MSSSLVLRIFLCAMLTCEAAFATAPAETGDAETITGVVVSSNGSPVSGALVIFEHQDQRLKSMSGRDGTFTLTCPQDLRFPIDLAVTARGFKPLDARLEHAPSELRLELEPSPMFSGEVEVTTNRALVGETPVTVSNIDRQEIERKNWGQDVPMLLEHVPGFFAYNDNGHGVGYSYFFLRGFDMRRTSVSLNGAPLNGAESHAVYFVDLANFLSTTGDIQVQRGVGTNLYGGSAIGGAVDLRSREPLSERRLRIGTSAGAWDTRRFDIEYDSGLVDERWATTFRYSRVESDGYREQSWLDAWNYYATVSHYGDKTTTRLILFGGPEETHLAYEGVTRAYLEGEITGDVRRDRRHNPLTYPGEIDSFFQPHYQLVQSWNASPDITVNSTLYYFEGDGYYRQYTPDAWMPQYNLDPFAGTDGDPLDTTDLIRKRSVDEWDAGWVPTVDWRHGGGRGTLQVGLALRRHEAHHFGEIVWAEYYPPGTPPDQRYYDYRVNKNTIQPFVQETWRLNDTVLLFGGMTWTSHRSEMHDDKLDGFSFDASYDFVLPRLGVSLTPSERWSLYANVSRGGREPAFRDIYDPQDYWFGDTPLDLEPEELTDFELGARHTWATGAAAMNLYYLDFDNAIVWAGGVDNDGLPITANGAKTTHFGAELEATWSPRPRFGGRVTAAYNNATFDEFVEFAWDGSLFDHSGNQLAGVPQWLASIDVSGGWGPLDLLLSVRHVGEFYLDNTENNRKYPETRAAPGYVDKVNDAYTTVNLGATIDLGERVAAVVGARRAEANLQVNNLLDNLYTTFGMVWGPEPTWIPAATRSVYGGVTVDW